jgi:hypothetical protein
MVSRNKEEIKIVADLGKLKVCLAIIPSLKI